MEHKCLSKSENCFDKMVHGVIMAFSHFPEVVFGQLRVASVEWYSTRIGMVQALSGGARIRD